MLMILVIGLVGAFEIINETKQFANSTRLRIQGVNFAREGIEAMENIRDTNWIKFGADYVNCWNTFNYDPACIGGAGSTDIAAGEYSLYRVGSLWYLRPSGTATYGGSPSLRTINSGITDAEFVDMLFAELLLRTPTPVERSNYLLQLSGGAQRTTLFDTVLALPEYQNDRTAMATRLGGTLGANFAVLLDRDGRSTQIGASDRACSAVVTSDCYLVMTRTIRITNISPDSMRVESIVRWADRSSSGLHDVTLSMLLTNWKADL